jgi:V/A-type H+-transporting ATPase subunit I
MAVSRMRRLQIIAHCDAKPAIIRALQDGGALHITEPTVDTGIAVDETSRREAERRQTGDLNKLEYLRTFLKPYAPKSGGMFGGRIVLDEADLERVVAGFDVDAWYERCVDLEGRMRAADAEALRLRHLAAELDRWRGLDAPVEDVTDTKLVAVSLLNVETNAFDPLERDLAEEAPASALVEVARAGAGVNCVVLFMKEEEGTVAPVLKRHGARTVDLSGAVGRPGSAAEELRRAAEEAAASIDSMRAEAEEVAREYDSVLVVHDEMRQRLARTTAEERFAGTASTFVVEGWVRGRDEEPLRQRIEEIAGETHFASRDPEAGEDVPIDLSNGKLVEPLEFVTTLYGRPIYWEFDPTPLLTPFFVVFFGLCLSDGGYGIALAAVAAFLMTKMERGGGGRKLMQLMLMGGIVTAIVGFLTGGWFGIETDLLPAFMRNAVLLNPLKEPMTMLNVVFVVGIIQIFAGLIIKMVAEFREGRWLDGVLDQLVWILFLLFLAPLGYGFILGGDVPSTVGDIAGKGALAMGAVVVLTGARKNPNPVMKVLGGVLKLYDVVGYFGDVLSYARLLALGLATGAIAMAINGVADMAMGIPVVGIVAAIIVIIGGHLFNLAVNTLGGFVHSARLQYLEFFSKFFEGGGRAFEPFRIQKKYSVVRREGA